MLVNCVGDKFITEYLCPKCGHYENCPKDYRCPAAELLSNLYYDLEEE